MDIENHTPFDALAYFKEYVRDDPRWIEAEDERLRRMAPFQLSAKLGGVYEVVEEISPSSSSGG